MQFLTRNLICRSKIWKSASRGQKIGTTTLESFIFELGFPGHFWEVCGNIPGTLLDISRTFPWHFREIFTTFSGNFRKISGNFPGDFQDISGGNLDMVHFVLLFILFGISCIFRYLLLFSPCCHPEAVGGFLTALPEKDVEAVRWVIDLLSCAYNSPLFQGSSHRKLRRHYEKLGKTRNT